MGRYENLRKYLYLHLMDYKTKRTFEFLDNYNRQNIEENVVHYREILGVLVEIHDFIHSSKINLEPWQSSLGTMLNKSFLNGYSITTLVRGQNLEIDYLEKNKINRHVIDIPSVYVLLRTLLENFLMIDFIFFQPKKVELGRFRYLCWEYSSLISASRYSTKDKPLIAKLIKKNTPILDEMWTEIIKSPYFDKKNTPKLKKYGDSRLGNRWDDLIKLSKLNPLLFDNLYSLLSKHAHSESAGIFQLKNSKLGYHKNHKDGQIPLLLSKSLTCLLILRLKQYIRIADIKFNTFSSSLRADIEIYGQFIDQDYMPSRVIKP